MILRIIFKDGSLLDLNTDNIKDVFKLTCTINGEDCPHLDDPEFTCADCLNNSSCDHENCDTIDILKSASCNTCRNCFMVDGDARRYCFTSECENCVNGSKWEAKNETLA